jgi:hypothetical protein
MSDEGCKDVRNYALVSPLRLLVFDELSQSGCLFHSGGLVVLQQLLVFSDSCIFHDFKRLRGTFQTLQPAPHIYPGIGSGNFGLLGCTC